MLQTERQEKILDLVNQDETVTIEKLINTFSVSRATIRRDIQELDEAGLVRKTRGGVLAIRRQGLVEPPLRMRQSMNVEEKKRIAKRALEYISDSDMIMLDSGTTTLELAKLLNRGKNVTAVTCDLDTATELSNRQLETVMLGGALRKGYNSVYGYFAERMLQGISVCTTFLAADAVHVPGGIMSYTADDVALKQQMIRCGDQVILLCDHSKFEQRAFVNITPFQDIDRIITGKEADGEVIRWLRENSDVKVDIV